MALTRDEFFWKSFSDHTEIAVKTAKMLVDIARNPSGIEDKRKQVAVLEREADTITHQVMNALHQTWITPLDREEIHDLIGALDDVVDAIDGIAERFRIYSITRSREEALSLADDIAAATIAMRDAVNSLSSRTGAGAATLEIIKKIGAEEHRSDETLSRALKRLFDEEKDPIEIMKWRDLYERMERATDRTLDVANVLEAIVLEHA